MPSLRTIRSAELRSPAPDTSMFDTSRADPGLQASWGRRHVDGLESTAERGQGPRKLAAGGRRSVKPMPASDVLDFLLGTDGHVEAWAPQRPVVRAVSGLDSAAGAPRARRLRGEQRLSICVCARC